MKKLSAKDIAQNTSMYDKYFNQYHMEDGWYPQNKTNNFSYLLELVDKTGIPISGTSCLDVGSGTGDFSKILRQRGAVEYLGIELYEPSYREAKKRYPQEKFVLADFLNFSLPHEFDYVFCSGALTVNLPDMDNYEYLQEAVEKMWQYSKIGVAFNVLTDNDDIKNDELFFYSTEKVVKICSRIIGEAELVVEHTPDVAQIHVYLYRVGLQQVS